ncbi:hypothetical protein MANES_14G165700v8 [Manihot esculenta]|uniref:Uncharacterized protein n=1 Tax=Manihot esculenta TaxID=3983 RepID=A0A2C9UM84_MANES|nr:hypothetical protein MANES_14G165700v8 [Manihot esculenta]
MGNSRSKARHSKEEEALPEVSRTKNQPEAIQTDKKVNKRVTAVQEAPQKSTEADGGDGDGEIVSTDLQDIIGRPVTTFTIDPTYHQKMIASSLQASSLTENTSGENEDTSGENEEKK